VPPGIDALPTRALGLDPAAARPARVARTEALADDAFETKLVAVIEQDLAIGEGLDPLEKGHARLAAKSVQIQLALRQRQAAQLDAVLVQEIKRQEHQLEFVRRARTHLPHQPVKMCAAPGIDQDQFPVEDCGLCLQLAEGLAVYSAPLLEYMRTPAPSLMTWKESRPIWVRAANRRPLVGGRLQMGTGA